MDHPNNLTEGISLEMKNDIERAKKITKVAGAIRNGIFLISAPTTLKLAEIVHMDHPNNLTEGIGVKYQDD